MPRGVLPQRAGQLGVRVPRGLAADPRPAGLRGHQDRRLLRPVQRWGRLNLVSFVDISTDYASTKPLAATLKVYGFENSVIMFSKIFLPLLENIFR